jgi:hypothetical protein
MDATHTHDSLKGSYASLFTYSANLSLYYQSFGLQVICSDYIENWYKTNSIQFSETKSHVNRLGILRDAQALPYTNSEMPLAKYH